MQRKHQQSVITYAKASDGMFAVYVLLE